MNVFDLKRETGLDLKYDNDTDTLFVMYANYPVFSITEDGYYQEWSGSHLLSDKENGRLFEIVEKFCESEGI